MIQMPMGRFLLGVFLAPVALGLLFTPIFLLDMGGLSFDGTTLDETFPSEGSVAAAKRRFTALLNVFLYSYVTTLSSEPPTEPVWACPSDSQCCSPFRFWVYAIWFLLVVFPEVLYSFDLLLRYSYYGSC